MHLDGTGCSVTSSDLMANCITVSWTAASRGDDTAMIPAAGGVAKVCSLQPVTICSTATTMTMTYELHACVLKAKKKMRRHKNERK